MKKYLKGTYLVDRAEGIAYEAHKGQTRKDGLTPYVVHPQRVAKAVEGYEAKAVAWLHDVLEDNKIDLTAKDLLKCRIPLEVVEAVEVLTKEKHENYEDYIVRVKQNKLATEVKVADLEDNALDGGHPENSEKYDRALSYLLG